MAPTDLDILKQLVNRIQPLDTEGWDIFAPIWQPYSCNKKHLLTSTGSMEKYLYFVVEGVQRIYHLDDQGKETTFLFTYPPSFGGVLDAFLLQQPSGYHYETITASRFLRAPYPLLEQTMRSCPGIEAMIRKGVAAALSGLLERIVELQSCSSEEKFRRLLQRSPHILQWIPHKFLANYLGIDPSNFSKLINKIRI